MAFNFDLKWFWSTKPDFGDSKEEFFPTYEKQKINLELSSDNDTQQSQELYISNGGAIEGSPKEQGTVKSESQFSDDPHLAAEKEDTTRHHVVFNENFTEEVHESQKQALREELPVETSLTVKSTNNTKKHKMFKDSQSEDLKEKEFVFATQMAEMIRKAHENNFEMYLSEIDCKLQKDFSFYLRFCSYKQQEEEEYTMKGFKDSDEALHNIRKNITDYFTTKKLLEAYWIDGETREALEILKKSPKGPNRMKNAEVERIWQGIKEEYQLILNYFYNAIDNSLHHFLQSNLERTQNSLKKSLNSLAFVRDLSNIELAKNLSSLVKEAFEDYVEQLRFSCMIRDDEKVSASLIEEIVEHVVAKSEAPKALWLMGFRKNLKLKVLSFLKQRLCKLYEHGEEQNTKKSKRVRKD